MLNKSCKVITDACNVVRESVAQFIVWRQWHLLVSTIGAWKTTMHVNFRVICQPHHLYYPIIYHYTYYVFLTVCLSNTKYISVHNPAYKYSWNAPISTSDLGIHQSSLSRRTTEIQLIERRAINMYYALFSAYQKNRDLTPTSN